MRTLEVLKPSLNADIKYRLAQCLCMATLTAAAARVADNFVPDGQILASGQKAGILGGLFTITLLSNAIGVKVSDWSNILPLMWRIADMPLAIWSTRANSQMAEDPADNWAVCIDDSDKRWW